MIRKMLGVAAALSAPGVALTIASERVIRPRVFYTGSWHEEPPDAVGWPYEEASIFTPDGLELQGWWFPAAGLGGERWEVRGAGDGSPQRHRGTEGAVGEFDGASTQAVGAGDGGRPGVAPTILFMHGTSYNASDMWVTAERATAFYEFLSGIEANFFVFDYRGYGRRAGRGYGRSGGTPTEEGTVLDSAAALGWLHQRADVEPASIFYYGFSLGTGIATELALREPPAGLILRAPFTSIRAMAVERHPRLRRLFAFAPWLPLTNFDTLSRIRRLRCPLLVMHGDADTTVPASMGQEVFEAAPEPKTWVTFAGSGHSDVAAQLVVPPITTFVAGVLETRQRSVGRA